MTETPTVFIIDDDVSVRISLARLIRSAGIRTMLMPSADEFLKRSVCNAPHCLVLDIQMPGTNGLELQRALLAAGRNAPIIFLTGHGDASMSVQAIKAGAAECLTKPCLGQDLLRAIDQALIKADRLFKIESENAEFMRLVDKLTRREREVLDLVITGHMNKEIAIALGTCEQTIKIHRMHMMNKMQVNSLADLVRRADKAGIFIRKANS